MQDKQWPRKARAAPVVSMSAEVRRKPEMSRELLFELGRIEGSVCVGCIYIVWENSKEEPRLEQSGRPKKALCSGLAW